MHYKNVFGVDFNFRNFALLAFLAIFPNILGLISMPTIWGFRIHFFQYLIFIAALIYGPFGGAVSGAFGSLYTAIALHNPYVIIGNIILGFFVGIFVKKISIILAVLAAYAIQVPWLWYSDIYLAGMPVAAVNNIIIALLIGNIIWALLAKYTYKSIKKAVI